MCSKNMSSQLDSPFPNESQRKVRSLNEIEKSRKSSPGRSSPDGFKISAGGGKKQEC